MLILTSTIVLKEWMEKDPDLWFILDQPYVRRFAGMESKVARMLRGGLSAHVTDYRLEWEGMPSDVEEDNAVHHAPALINLFVRQLMPILIEKRSKDWNDALFSRPYS
jgi:hypothetical protein